MNTKQHTKQSVRLSTALGIGCLLVSLVIAYAADHSYCYTIDEGDVDNLGYYDTCIGVLVNNCNRGCQVYKNISPGQYCGYCTDGSEVADPQNTYCRCSGIPVTAISKQGWCTADGGPNSCYCKFDDVFPPPEPTPITIEDCSRN